MYKVTKRDCPMFGIGPYVCEFICDTASDISTLPTSISEGTGGRTVYDNQKCASGSMAIIADNGAESKQYMLNNQDIWCPYSVAAGSSSGSGESSITVDFALSETSENPVANKTITAALNDKANTDDIPDLTPYAKKTDVPNIKVNSTVNADTVNGHTVEADVPADAKFTDTVPDLSQYAKKSDIPTKLPANGGIANEVRSSNGKALLYEDNEGGNFELIAPDGSHFMQMDLYNNTDFRMYFGDKTTGELNFPFYYKFDTGKIEINGDAATVNGHTVNADVPADAVFTDTIPDLSPYALKAKYGNTTINIGRREHAPVGEYSTSLGMGTVANGYASTAEGSGSQAAGYASHAGGCNCQAIKEGSFAHGYQVSAKHEYETAFGKHNVSNDDTLFSIGDGSEINTDGTISIAYHNAFEITKTGGKLHDKDILTSAHCIQFIPHNMKYYVLNGRILLFSNDDNITRGIYFVNNTPNDIVVCALISASAEGPVVQYGYGSNTYPEIQNTGEEREWFITESIQTSPTIFSMTVPSGKLGYYGLYQNSESAYATLHDIRCPYFNYF